MKKYYNIFQNILNILNLKHLWTMFAYDKTQNTKEKKKKKITFHDSNNFITNRLHLFEKFVHFYYSLIILTNGRLQSDTPRSFTIKQLHIFLFATVWNRKMRTICMKITPLFRATKLTNCKLSKLIFQGEPCKCSPILFSLS